MPSGDRTPLEEISSSRGRRPYDPPGEMPAKGAANENRKGPPMLIGYARCSTYRQDEDLTAQRTALGKLGVEEDRIYVDVGMSGTTRERPGLREALAALRAHDTLVVTKLDCLARSVKDASDMAEEIETKNAALSLGGSIHNPSDPMGRMFFSIMAVFAEFESDLIRARTREGMAIARSRGRLRGKRPKLSHAQEHHLVGLVKSGEHTTSEIAGLMGVSRATVYRAVERAKSD